MSKIRFVCNLGEASLRELDVPVEVRKCNYTLVARRLSSQFFDLEPGIYYVSVILPAGQELYRLIRVVPEGNNHDSAQIWEGMEDPDHVQEVLAGSDQVVELTPRNEDYPPYNFPGLDYYLAMIHFLDKPIRIETAAGLSEVQTWEPASPRLRIFVGNVLQGEGKLEDYARTIRFVWRDLGISMIDTSLPQHVRPLITAVAQLLQPGVQPQNLVLPVIDENFPSDAHFPCRLVLKRLRNGQWSIRTGLYNSESELLLGYLEKGYMQQAALLTTNRVLEHEDPLYSTQDKTEAAIHAYALLRFGDQIKLESFLRTFSLPNSDRAAIVGEYLSRRGLHAAALHIFLQLSQRGLPFFRDGLIYAIERLSRYVRTGSRVFSEKSIKADYVRLDLDLDTELFFDHAEELFQFHDEELFFRAEELLRRLQGFARFVSFQSPMLTYTGLDPNNPSDNLIDDIVDDIEVYGGFDLW